MNEEQAEDLQKIEHRINLAIERRKVLERQKWPIDESIGRINMEITKLENRKFEILGNRANVADFFTIGIGVLLILGYVFFAITS